MEKIVGVFGDIKARWFHVKWAGYTKPEWEREHLLRRDGCQESILTFWTETGLNPAKNYYPDPEGGYRCDVCGKSYKRAQDLKTHKTREGHHHDGSSKTTTTAKADSITTKRREIQKELPTWTKWQTTAGSSNIWALFSRQAETTCQMSGGG